MDGFPLAIIFNKPRDSQHPDTAMILFLGHSKILRIIVLSYFLAR
jgi:hypothetical protein